MIHELEMGETKSESFRGVELGRNEKVAAVESGGIHAKWRPILQELTCPQVSSTSFMRAGFR
jgi:hypothetical protein